MRPRPPVRQHYAYDFRRLSASSVVFQVLLMSLQPLTSVYPGADPGSPSDDAKGFIPVGCRIVARHGIVDLGRRPSAPQAFYLSGRGMRKTMIFSQEDDQAAYAARRAKSGGFPIRSST